MKCKISIPRDDDIGRFSVSSVYASILCIKFNINIEHIESRAKMMRLISSEYYNALVSHPKVRNVQNMGDTFLAIYDTPDKSDIDEIIELAARVNMLYDYFQQLISNDDSISTSMAIDYAPIFFCGMGSLDEDNPKVMYQGVNILKTIGMVEQINDTQKKNIIITPIIQSNIKKEYQRFFESLGDNFVSSVTYKF